jgi:hypothetical protein
MPIRRPDHGCHGYSSSRNSVLWAFSSLVVQHDQAPRLNRIQATSTRGVRARIRRVAGCAPPTGFAGHAGATANLKLTFRLDHSAGADQCELFHTSLVVQKIAPHGYRRSGGGSCSQIKQGCTGCCPDCKQNQNRPCSRASSCREPWSRFALGLLFVWFEISFDLFQALIECNHVRS